MMMTNSLIDIYDLEDFFSASYSEIQTTVNFATLKNLFERREKQFKLKLIAN